LADEASEKPRPFDVRTVNYLVRLMSRFDLHEIDLQEGDQRIRIRRGGRVVTQPSTPVVSVPAPARSDPTPPEVVHTPAPSTPAKKVLEIKAPTVGTFYAQKEPGAPPFVTVGDRVTPTTTVCIIEAMKVYNEIAAECTGVITEVLVQNKDFVEYGTVLFRVDPTG
jgi:acetyl-CoA carboxylase biotin carboxyl carrier protein